MHSIKTADSRGKFRNVEGKTAKSTAATAESAAAAVDSAIMQADSSVLKTAAFNSGFHCEIQSNFYIIYLYGKNEKKTLIRKLRYS